MVLWLACAIKANLDTIMPLSDTTIRNAKPADKPRKLSDEKGLHLLVTPAGGKLWRMQYRFGGKQKLLAFGAYPAVTLKEARERRDEARKMLANGKDPGAVKQVQKAAIAAASANSFEAVALEWLESRRDSVEPGSHAKTLARMENDVFPWLGGKPITEISAADVLTVLRRIDERGTRYTAHKVRSEISRAFRFAVATGRAERDPCPDLRGAIQPTKTEHMPAITTPKEAAELLRALDGLPGYVCGALCAAPCSYAVRPARRATQGRMVGLRSEQGRMAVSGNQDEDGTPGSAFDSSGSDPTRVARPDGKPAPCVSGT